MRGADAKHFGREPLLEYAADLVASNPEGASNARYRQTWSGLTR